MSGHWLWVYVHVHIRLIGYLMHLRWNHSLCLAWLLFLFLSGPDVALWVFYRVAIHASMYALNGAIDLPSDLHRAVEVDCSGQIICSLRLYLDQFYLICH